MCLGIPGQIVAIADNQRMMAIADISGVQRKVNVACVLNGSLEELVGEWVLIHVGFAMAIVDRSEAERCLAALRMLGQDQE